MQQLECRGGRTLQLGLAGHLGEGVECDARLVHHEEHSAEQEAGLVQVQQHVVAGGEPHAGVAVDEAPTAHFSDWCL